MKPTVKNVQALLDGKEPDRGGYGSEFEYDQDGDTVQVTFKADWLPRYMEPVYVITDVDPETTVLTYHLLGKDRIDTDTAEVFAEEICGEYGG